MHQQILGCRRVPSSLHRNVVEGEVVASRAAAHPRKNRAASSPIIYLNHSRDGARHRSITTVGGTDVEQPSTDEKITGSLKHYEVRWILLQEHWYVRTAKTLRRCVVRLDWRRCKTAGTRRGGDFSVVTLPKCDELSQMLLLHNCIGGGRLCL